MGSHRPTSDMPMLKTMCTHRFASFTCRIHFEIDIHCHESQLIICVIFFNRLVVKLNRDNRFWVYPDDLIVFVYEFVVHLSARSRSLKSKEPPNSQIYLGSISTVFRGIWKYNIRSSGPSSSAFGFGNYTSNYSQNVTLDVLFKYFI